MSYQTAQTIKDVISSIQSKDYVLPSIQREFVWDMGQIETLFDSLMRDYPIGTFYSGRLIVIKLEILNFMSSWISIMKEIVAIIKRLVCRRIKGSSPF